ncbi:helix-turn-helix transcriptional regulator [Dysgonomonas sp. GY617]|nr:helix-turn-helix transcriptional regulator [Dysgonomonas sp. GY617]
MEITNTEKEALMSEEKIVNNIIEGICPIRDIIASLSDKWSLLVIYTLSQNPKMRFGEIHKSIPDISQRMLTVTLRSLEADGLVSRQVFPEVPPRVEYQLTDLGYSLLDPLRGLVNWALKNTEVIQESRESYQQ